MAAVVATNLKRGMCLKYEGELGIIIDTEHRTPGKGNALIMATVRSVNSGKTKAIRFASNDKCDIVDTERQKLEFSYADQNGYYFMDTTSYETIELPAKMLGDGIDFLAENMEVEVLFIEGNPVSAELPPSVELEVTESSEGIKGDTANNPTKPARIASGREIQVTLFVEQGDIIKIDTRTGKYLGRA